MVRPVWRVFISESWGKGMRLQATGLHTSSNCKPGPSHTIIASGPRAIETIRTTEPTSKCSKVISFSRSFRSFKKLSSLWLEIQSVSLTRLPAYIARYHPWRYYDPTLVQYRRRTGPTYVSTSSFSKKNPLRLQLAHIRALGLALQQDLAHDQPRPRALRDPPTTMPTGHIHPVHRGRSNQGSTAVRDG